jgi:hypothetical protein
MDENGKPIRSVLKSIPPEDSGSEAYNEWTKHVRQELSDNPSVYDNLVQIGPTTVMIMIPLRIDKVVIPKFGEDVDIPFTATLKMTPELQDQISKYKERMKQNRQSE